ncbi:ferritin-like domain-containing protein [Coprococcus sp. OM06-25]|uniref:ferritin-like domain-containing protein n=1 Tax=Coprococcus sp. OM06-25 TaxID=2293094 RepID=UPI001FA87115|nr:ferritin-like domain-containing protein [Coprococcus sp. OM06-25]
MILKEKEKTVIQDLQTQEKSCVEKYGRYAEQAKDPELKNLFQTIQKEEQKHYDSLTRCLTDRFHSVTAMTAMEKIMSQSRHTR